MMRCMEYGARRGKVIGGGRHLLCMVPYQGLGLESGWAFRKEMGHSMELCQGMDHSMAHCQGEPENRYLLSLTLHLWTGGLLRAKMI